jgi:hypothetical protein
MAPVYIEMEAGWVWGRSGRFGGKGSPESSSPDHSSSNYADYAVWAYRGEGDINLYNTFST